MLSYNQLQKRPKDFLAMTGLQLNEFRKLLAAFEATYLQHSLQELTLAGHARQRHVGGGAKCTSLNLEQFVEGRKRCL